PAHRPAAAGPLHSSGRPSLDAATGDEAGCRRMRAAWIPSLDAPLWTPQLATRRDAAGCVRRRSPLDAATGDEADAAGCVRRESPLGGGRALGPCLEAAQLVPDVLGPGGLGVHPAVRPGAQRVELGHGLLEHLDRL